MSIVPAAADLFRARQVANVVINGPTRLGVFAHQAVEVARDGGAISNAAVNRGPHVGWGEPLSSHAFRPDGQHPISAQLAADGQQLLDSLARRIDDLDQQHVNRGSYWPDSVTVGFQDFTRANVDQGTSTWPLSQEFTLSLEEARGVIPEIMQAADAVSQRAASELDSTHTHLGHAIMNSVLVG